MLEIAITQERPYKSYYHVNIEDVHVGTGTLAECQALVLELKEDLTEHKAKTIYSWYKGGDENGNMARS